MKQTIGLVLSVVWLMLLIIGAAEPTGEYEVSTPEWVGWVYVILFLGLPFISFNLIISGVDKSKQ